MFNSQQYWCHTCSAIVTIEENDNLICSKCNGEFLEAMEADDNQPQIFNHLMMGGIVQDDLYTENQAVNIIQQFLNLLVNQSEINLADMTLSDVVMGHGSFEEILQQLMEQSENGQKKPASTSAVEQLKVDTINQKEVEEKTECCICREEFVLDTKVKLMPCDHKFHIDCLDPWLKLKNSCPVCRHELPTDN